MDHVKPTLRVLSLAFCVALAAVLSLTPAWKLAYSAQTSAPVQARIPSEVAWTEDTIGAASGGDPIRGLLLARRCERCHGVEGFSAAAVVPNLAGMDRLSFYKQMEDFRTGHRDSALMQPIAVALAARDFADLAAYYSMLPASPDPQGSHVFPQTPPAGSRVGMAVPLISLGDGRRGIPPCQSCHGPVARVTGAPSLMTQNSDYILQELNNFANGSRANDINVRMRSIASQLSDAEKAAIAQYYGAGFGNQ